MVYAAAILIVLGVSLFVAAPLFGPVLRIRRANRIDLEFEHLEHDRALAIQGLRELEFDQRMNKISESDYVELRTGLEGRALEAMSAIERLGTDTRSGKVAPLRPRTSAVAGAGATAAETSAAYCAQCGERALANANFCARCGGALLRKERA